MLRLGLTGGIGSGKSTLARMWAARGAAWIDADANARALTAPGGAAIAAIRTQFGEALMTPSGALDRAAMRALIFAQPQARQQLEAIIHPLVGQATAAQAAQAAAQGCQVAIFDIPLLVESGHWAQRLDAVAVVDCSAETQIQRTMARSGLERSAVQAIIDAQASRAQRRAAADIVIDNEAPSLAALEAQAEQIAIWLQL
ncbi:MAG: dephospho-CoA kinase [Comamonadaceae bacterium]|jgi:dephospho-CoA kinase|nr:dephospho-CoA kinase [Comamonadaceae bacterium]